jgi:hypothetical protein
MIPVALFIYILFLHYLADFIFQPYELSIRKSESYFALLNHVVIYTCTIYLGLLFVVSLECAIKFAALNFIFHFLVDWATSRVISDNSSRLLLDPDASKPIHKRLQLWGPISLLGFDQFLHQAGLLISLYLIL